MEKKFYFKRKLYDTLAGVLFLIGSYIIYRKLGKWVAIGVAVEVLSMYLMIYIHFFYGKKDPEIEEDEKKRSI